MVIFDCDTRMSAMESVSIACGLDSDLVEERLRSLGCGVEFEGVPDAAVEALGSWDEVRFSGTRCYHYTRCAWPERYHRTGLSPLSRDLLGTVWDEVVDVLKLNLGCADFERFLGDTAYGRRYLVERALHSKPDGPWAYLSRARAFHGESAHYMRRAPEIVEDLLLWFEHDRGWTEMVPAYSAATRPCIVHFVVPGVPERARRCALRGLYYACFYDAPWVPAACFDGGGLRVGAEQVERVEVLDDADIGRDRPETVDREYQEVSVDWDAAGFSVVGVAPEAKGDVE